MWAENTDICDQARGGGSSSRQVLSFGRGFSPLGPTQGTRGPRLVGLEVLRPPLCQGGQLQFPKQSWASSGSVVKSRRS